MIAKKNRRPIGRPPKDGSKAMRYSPLAVRLPEAMISQIDAIAADRLDQPDRSTVIRQLLAEALEARAGARKKKGGA